MKRVFILSFPLIVALLATGCQSTGIVQLSPDTYMITKEDHRGIFAFNRSKLKTDTIREANDFAEKKGKIAAQVSLKEHPMGILGDWASVEYQFRVIDKNSFEVKPTTITLPRMNSPTISSGSSSSDYAVSDFRIVEYDFDAQTGRGNVTVDMAGKGFNARLWIIKNIGMICSSKNVALDAGNETFNGAKYTVLNESIRDGLLKITFQAVY